MFSKLLHLIQIISFLYCKVDLQALLISPRLYISIDRVQTAIDQFPYYLIHRGTYRCLEEVTSCHHFIISFERVLSIFIRFRVQVQAKVYLSPLSILSKARYHRRRQ